MGMHVETLVVGPLGTNCYVLSSGDSGEAGDGSGEVSGDSGEAIIIDPGGSFERIRDYIERSGVKPVMIVLTHGHSDHMASAARLAAEYGIGVAMHENDIDTLERSVADAPMWGLGSPDNVSTTRRLSAGDKIEFGEAKGTVLHTPGHTKGGISILFDGAVFVGDTLFAGSIGRTDFFGGDMKTILASIRSELFTLPDDTVVYTGHGPATTIGEEKRHNPFFDGTF
jgi:glyoxylase-like metal-dependent hydrolase (beta-lactamase superfamily II)